MAFLFKKIMILISVKSEAMDCKKQVETDKEAEKYLLWVKKWHDMARINLLGQRPRALTTKQKQEVKNYDAMLKVAIPLRIEIINTLYNQHSIQL